MSLYEISLDYNIVDVAFSKSGTNKAVLTTSGFALYTWELKRGVAQEPQFAFFHSFSQPTERARQISFLSEDDVYVLKQNEFGQDKINRINISTKEEETIFVPEMLDCISAIFPDLRQGALWIAMNAHNSKARSYFYISNEVPESPSVVPWSDSPTSDTIWAHAIKLKDGNVSLSTPPTIFYVLYSLYGRIYCFRCPDRAQSMRTNEHSPKVAPHF